MFAGMAAENLPVAVPPQKPGSADVSLTPSQALGSFKLEKGLRVELAASEPLVMDPVAFAFDERGRLFVVEDRGYPTGPSPGQPPAGVIALLEDTHGNGVYDKRFLPTA
jgi:hypothetical protein